MSGLSLGPGVGVAQLCRNAGSCLDAGSTHYCHCQRGFTGSYCEQQVNECTPNPCQNGAACSDLLGGYSCQVRMRTGCRDILLQQHGLSRMDCTSLSQS